MIRLKNYARALLSGYLLMGANVFYTLASVPLALHYLSHAQFGLWALTTQIAGYFALIDVGMSGAISRILIEHKDQRGNGSYGSVIQVAVGVGVAQGVLVLLLGLGVSRFIGPVLDVPDDLRQDFAWLMIAQCGLLALTFCVRISQLLLIAYQRYDVTNLSQAVSFGVSYCVLWYSFARGLGVFSVVWAQAIALVLVTTVHWIGCARLKLLPAPGEWGAPTWERFKELFSFGGEIFLYNLGFQLINASQTILLTRQLGLEMATVWSICTRTYFLIQQLVHRLFDYSYAALAEMAVRQETARLVSRFKSVVVVSVSLGVVAGAGFMIANQTFVRLWTGGQIGWSPINDVLLAFSLLISVLVRLHIGLIGVLKDFRFLKYLFFIEGAYFVVLSLLMLRPLGIPAMLAAAVFSSLIFSLPYGLWRTSQYFQISWKEVALDWNRPALRLALWLAVPTVALWYVTRRLSPLLGLVTATTLLGLLGMALLWRCGLDVATRNELAARIPRWLRPGQRREPRTNA